MTDAGIAKEELREWLVKHTGCDIQEGRGIAGWPCGTCTVGLLKYIGLDSSTSEYNEHNDPTDRCNEVWRAILQIRES